MFKPAIAAAGLKPYIRVHELRHTAASLMIQGGAPPQLVMAQLGHSSIKVTMDVYAHLFPNDLDWIADIMGAHAPASDTTRTVRGQFGAS